MEMSLTVSQGVQLKSRKLNKSQEEWQKNLAEMEEGLYIKQFSLIACTQQLSRGAATASSSHVNLKSELTSGGLEPWSAM